MAPARAEIRSEHGPELVAPQTSSVEAGTVLPPSTLLPPVQGLKPEQRSDLGRSVHLVRLQWQSFGEDD